MKKADDIGEISIEQDRIDWKITQFAKWPNFKKGTVIYSPLFHFAGGYRYFSAYLTLEEGSVILSGMSITRCRRDSDNFHCIIFGIIEDSNEVYILVTSLNAHGGMASDHKLKYKKKEIIKFGGNLHLFCSWKAVGSITDELSDDFLSVLQLKDEKTTYNDVATQQDMKRTGARMKNEKARCKKVATQVDMTSGTLLMKDEKTGCKKMATQEDRKSAALRMKDEKARCKEVAAPEDIKSAALRMKDEKARCKEVAAQEDMKSATFRMKDEKARCEEVVVQEDIKSVADIGNLGQNFKNLLLNGEDHDLILKVSNKEFRAHQCILRVRSPVLDSMLSHDMIQKKSGIIDIPDCDPGIFEQFLLYLYSGEVERLDEGNMLSLYNIADKYDMGHLKKQCREFIKNSLTSINVSDVIELALVHSDGVLQEFATDYFLKHASAVLRTVEWQSFTARNIIQANELYMKSVHSLKAKNI